MSPIHGIAYFWTMLIDRNIEFPTIHTGLAANTLHLLLKCSTEATSCPDLHMAMGFVAQMVFWDSLYESSVIAEGDELSDPYEA
jgi:hypothetical protein